MSRLWAISLGDTLSYMTSFNPDNNDVQEGTMTVISQMRIMRSERSGDLSDVTQ